jgi:hypothetical protein
VRAEACDVIVTAMVLLARMGGDGERLFREDLRQVAARSPAAEC